MKPVTSTTSQHAGQRYALVVEDHALTMTFIADAVARAGFEVMTASDVATALSLIDQCEFELAVVDLDLGEGPPGTIVVDRLGGNSGAAIVVLTAFRSPSVLGASQRSGTLEYVAKTDVTCVGDLHSAVERALAGSARPRADGSTFTVTRTEMAVLRLMAAGLSNEAIAARQGSTRRAVEHIVRRLFRSLELVEGDGRSRRVQAVLLYQAGSVGVAPLRRRPPE